MSTDLADALRAVLVARRGDPDLVVEGLTRLSGGASRETWAFDAASPGEPPQRLILQRGRPGSSVAMTNEIDVLHAAARAGVKVPTVVSSSPDPDALGAPFVVVTSVAGETIARRILRDAAYAAARTHLVDDCAAELAKIHAIDPSAAPGLSDADQLDQLRLLVDGYDEALPTFELAFRWLESHRPPTSRSVIVHGDFRLGNFVVDRDGLAAVLDWELTHVGDPMEDLGWLCVRAWRFGSEQPVAGVGDYDDLFAAYERAGGPPVDPDAVRWWEVLGTLKWGVICIVQYHAHRDGNVRSVELAAIGRRVCEAEYDLLRLLP